jgi:hypothetical protein
MVDALGEVAACPGGTVAAVAIESAGEDSACEGGATARSQAVGDYRAMRVQNQDLPYGTAKPHITFRAVQLFERSIQIENEVEERDGVALVPATSAEYRAIKAALGQELKLGAARSESA